MMKRWDSMAYKKTNNSLLLLLLCNLHILCPPTERNYGIVPTTKKSFTSAINKSQHTKLKKLLQEAYPTTLDSQEKLPNTKHQIRTLQKYAKNKQRVLQDIKNELEAEMSESSLEDSFNENVKRGGIRTLGGGTFVGLSFLCAIVWDSVWVTMAAFLVELGAAKTAETGIKKLWRAKNEKQILNKIDNNQHIVDLLDEKKEELSEAGLLVKAKKKKKKQAAEENSLL